MNKPSIKKYSGEKKRIQNKLFHKRERRHAVESANNSLVDSSNLTNNNKNTYSFFENINYQKLHNSEADEYYFSSTRKGYNYYGIIIKIFRNENSSVEEKSKPVFTGQGISIFKSVFDKDSFYDFSNHIKFLGKEEYVLKCKDMQGFYDIGTFPYTATELRFYIDSNGRIGDYYEPELYKVIMEEFNTAHLKYFSDESFALFCALEHLPLETSYVALLLSDFFYPFCYHEAYYPNPVGYNVSGYNYGLPSEWWINKVIIDIQNFANGINGALLFSNFPLKEVDASNNVQIFRPDSFSKNNSTRKVSWWRDQEQWEHEENEARVVKITDFKKSGLSYWFLYAYDKKSTKDEMDFFLDIFEKSSIDIHE
jgi:hypothetical protein